MRPRIAASVVVLGAVVLAARAQAQIAPVWSAVAGYTVNLGLAGPATGPVRSVWYTAGGARLLVRTESGRIFETTDFQHWKLNSSDTVPAAPPRPDSRARPEAGLQILTSGLRRYSVTQ